MPSSRLMANSNRTALIALASGRRAEFTALSMMVAMSEMLPPPRMTGTTLSPSTPTNTNTDPMRSPGIESGSTMWRMVASGLPPRSALACRISSSMRLIASHAGKIMNGR